MVRGKLARKPQRGGGKSYSKHLGRLDEDGNPIETSPWSHRGDKEDSDGSEESESLDEEKGPGESHQESNSAPTIEIVNPNRLSKTTMKASEIGKSERDLSRREREAMDAAAAKERYWKLHEEGKTEQAKADLARLAIVRKQREEAAARRKVEEEQKRLSSQAKLDKSGKRIK